MRGRKERAQSAGPALAPLAVAEALCCRGEGRPAPLDPTITVPPPPVPPVIVPLPDAEGLACRGGDDPIKDIRALIDWITGKPPAPDQWPPLII